MPNNSRIELNTTTVINVDSVLTYNAAYNGGAVQGTFYPNTNVFVRAQISDPFGAFDISSARITITDPANTVHVNNVAMTAQAAPATCGPTATATATCIFQTQFTVPASPVLGGWTVRVTGLEGVENTVTDLGVGNFIVAIPQPSLTILKSSTVLSDPVNGTTLPEAHPARGSSVRRDDHQQRAGHRGFGNAGHHRSDSRRRVDVCVHERGQSRGVREWRDRERAHLQLRHACHVFVRGHRAVPGPTPPCPTPTASMPQCEPSGLPPRAS